MKIGGFLLAVLAILAVIMMSESAWVFVDLPGAIFVILVGGGIVMAAHGARGCSLLFRSRRLTQGSTECDDARRVAETGIQAFVAAGWLGVLVGVTQMLAALDDPSTLGAGMAVALLTAFYGHAIAYLFWMPLARSLTASQVQNAG